jgi:glycerate kinase
VTARVPTRALLVSSAFSQTLSAQRVAGAIARGLRAGGAEDPDICALDRALADELAMELERLRFDARMRAARAVILAAPSLDPQTLARGSSFEIATRARQAGVPAYAVAGESRLSSFDARVLDLQLVLTASMPRALAAAGRQLAGVL